MTFILNNAVEGYDKRLAYFTKPLTNTSIEGYNYRNYNPIGQIDNKTPIEFDIVNNSTDYIDLSEIYLTLKLKIVKDNDTTLIPDDDVTLINFIATSAFRQLDFSIQQKNINSSVGANFPYKCMFDVLIEQGKHAQKTRLLLGGFSKDNAKVMDDFTTAASANVGLTDKNAWTKDGTYKTFKTKIFSDLCQQDRFLPGGIPLNMKFYHSPDLFRLMYASTTGPYSIVFKEAKISIPYVKLNPGYLNAQSEILKKEVALLRFTKSVIKTYTIGQGDSTWSCENLFQDNIPHRLIVGLIDSRAYSGHSEKNPFNFQHFKSEYLNFEVNGQTIGSEILQPDFLNENYASCYSNLIGNIPWNQTEIPNISYSDFGHGYALFVFNMIKKVSNYDIPNFKGQTRLSLKFKDRLAQSISLIAYGSFSSVMSIDESKNINIAP